MQDFLKKYQNHKLITNINVIIASLFLATLINFFLIDWTNIGQNLKASVLNSKIWDEKADIYIQKNDTGLFLIANKNIANISTLSFSLSYNPDNIKMLEILSDIWEIVNLSNTPGINSIILNTNEPTNIVKWDKLIKINLKKIHETTENINIVNANFKDVNNEQFLLSTSGITF